MWKCKEWWNIHLTLGIWHEPLTQHPLPPARINKYSLIATINHSGNLRIYIHLVGILPMTTQFLMLTKVLLTIPSHTFFFTVKCNFFSGSTEMSFYKGIFSFQTMSLGMMTPHISPVLCWNWAYSLNVQALQTCSP